MLKAFDDWIQKYVTEDLNSRKTPIKILSRTELEAARVENEESEALLQNNSNNNSQAETMFVRPFPAYPRVLFIQSIWVIAWNMPQIALLLRLFLWIGNRSFPGCVIYAEITYFSTLLYLLALLLSTTLFFVLAYSEILHRAPQLKLKLTRLYPICNFVEALGMIMMGSYFLISPHLDGCVDSTITNAHSQVSTEDFFFRLALPLVVFDAKMAVGIFLHCCLPKCINIINFQTNRVKGFQFTRELESKLSRQVMLPSRHFNKTTNIDIQFQLQCNRVKGISFHPTLPWILISFHTGGIEIWDYEAKRKEFQFDGHDGPVRAVNFHAELPLFASGGDDYAIRVWNYEEKNCDIVLLGHLDYIRAVKFHHQYSLLASCSDDQTIRFWDVFERKCISIVAWHNHYVMGVSFHPTEDLIVSCSLDQTVRVWNFSGLKRPDGSFEGEEGGSTCCKTQPAVVVKFILQGHERGVNWAIFHPTDPSLVISGADDRMIKVWKCNDSRAWEVDTFEGPLNNVSSVYAMPLLKDLLLAVSEDRTMRIWNMTEKKQVYQLDMESRGWVLEGKENLCAVGHDNGLILLDIRDATQAV